MNLQLPYHSRRDEVGGAITDVEWNAFTDRLENIIKRVDRKRSRIIKRRKRRGKKKMPRKTLFKPAKAINLSKDPLWNEIFIDNKEEDQESDSDEEDQLMMNMYKAAAKEHGVKLNIR